MRPEDKDALLAIRGDQPIKLKPEVEALLARFEAADGDDENSGLRDGAAEGDLGRLDAPGKRGNLSAPDGDHGERADRRRRGELGTRRTLSAKSPSSRNGPRRKRRRDGQSKN